MEDVAARTITTIEAYGSCMYHSRTTDKFYYIVTNKRGEVEQLELFDVFTDPRRTASQRASA